MAELLSYISCEWKVVAGYLRISNSTIEMLERSTDDDCTKMNHVITEWMNGESTCTWEVISDIAHIVDNKRLLQKLYSRFAVSVDTGKIN